MADVYDSPEFQRYANRVRAELEPMIKDSAVCVSILPSGETDVKFAVELGYMIMLDKPIIVVVQPGSKVPSKLALVADIIVEGRPGEPGFEGRFKAAIGKVIPNA